MNNARQITFASLTAALFLWSAAAAADWIETRNRMMRSAYREILLPELDRSVSHHTPWPGEDPLTSKAAVDSGGPVTVGPHATIEVAYIAGAGGMKKGGGIRVAFEHGADWGRLQFKNPEKENYARVTGPDGVKWKLRANYMLGVCALLEALVEEGEVAEGQEVKVVLGDRSGGSPGLKATTVSEVPGAGRVRVFEDRSGEGHFYEMPGISEIEVKPDLPHHLRVIARSWAVVGAPVDAVVHVDDRFNNVVTGYQGWFAVSGHAAGDRLGDVKIHAGDKGVARIEGLACEAEGIMRLEVSSVAGGLSAISNPIECLPGPEAPRTYFGSIHNHTLASDGLNTMEGAADYARDVSNLDFFALTEHVIWPDWAYDPVLLRHAADGEAWERAASVVREFNAPGEFVAILGFEWTTTTYGDKNVYFLDDHAPFREFPPGQPGLYEAIEGERATVITHTMMGVSGVRGPRWDFCDNRRERVMEIASYHGVREYAGNAYPICPSDARIPAFVTRGNLAHGVLKRGLRLGFVGGSDDHSGKPGAANRGILSCSIDGLTGVRARRLTRETIFESIENRATYATTGARILLDFSVNGHGMGEETRIKPGSPRIIRVEAHGEAPVKEVAIIREDPKNPAKTWTFEPPIYDPGVLEWTDSSPLKDSTWYYARVMQSDNHMAWS